MATQLPIQSFDTTKTSDIEYFSGSNVNVFFNHIWVREITSIQFQLTEKVQPIYGFNSYTFDRVARGNRIVEGQFTINFSNKGYLQNILKALCSPKENETAGIAKTTTASFNSSAALEKLMSAEAPAKLEELKTQLKNQLWGSTVTVYNSTPLNTKYQNPHFYSLDTGLLRGPGFDIKIEYSPDANDVDFQNCLRNNKIGPSAFHTHRILNEVHISSIGQAISPDGNVLQEVYSFIAKDIDATDWSHT